MQFGGKYAWWDKDMIEGEPNTVLLKGERNK
jgi:hypothetical protein